LADIKGKQIVEREIPPIPEMPPKIIQAIENDTLVIFIGAGVSRLMGCKGWDELARDLVKKCYKLGHIEFREKETLELERDHKKTITECYNLLKNEENEDVFFEIFDKALECEDNLSEAANIYRELSLLNAVFVTTNADRHFDAYFRNERIYYDSLKFVPDDIGTRKLFHLHGSQKQNYRHTLVFTVDRYIQTYNDPKFQGFLQALFRQDDRTVLFMGYGLSEFELLDYVIGKVLEGNKVYRHFILLPYYREEVRLKEVNQLYYDHLGIEILGYQKDQRGYEQLYYVVKDWFDQQIRKTNLVPKKFKYIDDFVSSL